MYVCIYRTTDLRFSIQAYKNLTEQRLKKT